MNNPAATYVEETRFGFWFLQSHVWQHHVLRVAINDLRSLFAGPLPEAPVLMDAGCGQGKSFSLLAEAFKPARIIGLDADPHSLDCSRAEAERLGLEVQLIASDCAAIDLPDDHEERAIYVVSGALLIDGETYDGGKMVVFATGATPEITATADTRFMQLGGAPLDGDRTIWWNFVSSDKDRMEAAKTRWKSGGFESVPGDAEEFIPLPED